MVSYQHTCIMEKVYSETDKEHFCEKMAQRLQLFARIIVNLPFIEENYSSYKF